MSPTSYQAALPRNQEGTVGRRRRLVNAIGTRPGRRIIPHERSTVIASRPHQHAYSSAAAGENTPSHVGLARLERDRHTPRHPPGNPGNRQARPAVDVPVSKAEIYRLTQYCDRHDIGLVVIGPEAPLAEGFADELRSPTRDWSSAPTPPAPASSPTKPGPSSSCGRRRSPPPRGSSFSNPESAIMFLESRDEAHVVKATGLAAGKGVLVPESLDEPRSRSSTQCMIDEEVWRCRDRPS
jgi:hypothetical protein